MKTTKENLKLYNGVLNLKDYWNYILLKKNADSFTFIYKIYEQLSQEYLHQVIKNNQDLTTLFISTDALFNVKDMDLYRDVFKNHKNLKQITLNCESPEILLEMIEENQTIESIEFRLCSLTFFSIQKLINFIEKNKNIKNLSFVDIEIKCKEDVNNLSLSLAKSNRITSITVFSKGQFNEIYTIIKSLTRLRSLKMNLEINNEILYESLIYNASLKELELDFFNSNFQEQPLFNLLKKLEKLESLKIYIFATIDISEALLNDKSLTSLELNGCIIPSFKSLFNNLNSILTLETLILNCSNFDNDATIYLSNYLPKSNLKNLDLSRNEFKTSGLKNIIDGIIKMNTLQSLILVGNDIPNSGSIFNYLLRENKTLTNLDIERCILGGELHEIGDGLVHNKTLKSLNIKYIIVNEKVLEYFTFQLFYNYSITSLTFSNNKDQHKLEEIVKRNQSIVKTINVKSFINDIYFKFSNKSF